MSTWFTESFRGEHFQAVASLPNSTIEGWKRFVKLTSVPFNGGVLEGKKCIRDNIRAAKYYYPVGKAKDLVDDEEEMGIAFRNIFWEWAERRRGKRSAKGEWDILTKLMDDYSDYKWVVGLDAVYDLMTSTDTWLADKERDVTQYCLKFTRETMVGLCEAARYTPEVGEEQFNLIDGYEISEFTKYRLFANQVREVYKMRYSQHRRKRADDGSLSIPGLLPKVRTYYIGPLTVLRVRNRVYVLNMCDMDRIQQCLVSQAMLHLYLATAASKPSMQIRKLKDAIRSEVGILFDLARTVDYQKKQILCKYYKKAMDLYQSYLAGPLSDERRDDLIADVREAPEEFDLFSYVIRLRRYPLEIAQEAGKVYRLLCAPDYDIGQAFIKRAKQLKESNPKGGHIHREVPLHLSELKQYHAAMLIDAAARMNNNRGVGRLFPDRPQPAWWDRWIATGERPNGIQWVDEFDWAGAVKFHQRDSTDPDVWKDSTTCEEDWAEVMADRENPVTARRNMLTRLLRDDECPMPETSHQDILRKTHVLRAGLKMEAHKDVARIFYIGNLADRLYGSQIEHNIAKVAENVSGFTVGGKIANITKRIGRCYAPEVKSNRSVFHISSDYEAWSPGMGGDVQRMSHENWAKLFGRPDLTNQKWINEDSYLLLNKRGYQGAVHNSEANYEGLNGKEMTVLHCAFVGYTIYRARKGGLQIPTVDFAAFIDDAILTLVLPNDNAKETFLKFWDYYVETTAFFRFKLDKAKCYLSDRFLIYLNEVYYGGRHIAHGLRAVMRIGTRDATRGETILDIMQTVGSGCRGAAKCGLNPVQIWKVCIIVQSIEMYIRFGDDELSARSAVFFCYAPRILGGLQSPIGLTLDCNFSGNGSTEAMAYIKTYTKYNEDVEKWFLRLIRTSVRVASGPSFLKNHRTVSADGAAISSDYLSGAIRVALRDYTTSTFGNRLLAYADVSDDVDLGEAILKHTHAISATVLEGIKASLVSGVFNSFLRKFDSSATLIKIVGVKKLWDIEQRIRSDEMSYIRHFRSRVVRP